MPTIESASRRVPKATYVPLRVNPREDADSGSALVKYAFIRNLRLQPGEVDAVQRQIRPTASTSKSLDPVGKGSDLWATLRAFEGSPLEKQLPPAATFANIPTSALKAFGQALVELRRASATTPAAVTTASSAPNGLALLNASLVATGGFEANVTATPIGMLNLERLEMTPAGIERGELLATVCLAPKERTSVVQKEWSVTTREFTSIVTDSLDNYSETGVTENTELAQSTNSQVQHSNQFNINATASGGIGFVTSSLSTSFTAQDSTSQSAQESRKHAVETTRKASSRVKQEHKTTISTSTVTGTSETTTRMLENPSATDPIRIDYFSLMRKWRVRLYRYGLRLTYDIAIPEPGAAMREAYEQLDVLQQQLGQAFSFPLAYADITEQNYMQLAGQYGAQVPTPPLATITQTLGGPIPGLKGDDSDQSWHFAQLSFTVPDGYAVADVKLETMLSNVSVEREFHVFGTGTNLNLPGGKAGNAWDLTAADGFMRGYAGTQTLNYFVQNCGAGSATFTILQGLTPQAMAQWIASVWTALYNAAQSAFLANQQVIAAQIQALQDKITGVDTLTLRREESDEIMKNVLRWLLGTEFDFMPPTVQKLFTGPDLKYGVAFTGSSPNELGLQPQDWTTMYQYQEMVKFINEAIEWENVTYFLYSYFWDVPQSWDFIRQIKHPDATRQAFLRSGSARIVLTVRKGFEQAWMSFVELGDFANALPPTHPYMSIAQEIQAYDDTNYPGIPAANPGGPDLTNLDAAATGCSQSVHAASGPVNMAVDSSDGFTVGATVIIDTYDSGVQESQTITKIPDAKHVTVGKLANAHNGTTAPFPIVQAGEAGLLIAEWNEYTPTSGTDIAMTSNLTQIG